MLTFLLALPLLLMAWGSLRDTVTPLGYWVLWGLWACAAVAYAGQGWNPRPARDWVWWIVAAFGLLVVGMVVSGWANSDLATLYQALKILVIGLLFAAMWGLGVRANAELLISVLYGALALVTVAFFVSRAVFSTDFDLGNRQGDIFAMPGVLWKSGLLFLPLLLADGLSHPARWRRAACAIGACVFLTVADGSRTGLLLIVAIFLAMAAVLWARRDWVLVRRRPWMLPLAAGTLIVLLLLDAGLGVLRVGGISWPSSAGSESSRVEALMDSAVAPVVDSRLGNGDQPRIRLLRNGLAKSRECFPLGCGFGSTAIDAGYGFPQNVHNAYLAALADFGVLGFLGMLAFIVAAALPLRVALDRTVPAQQAYFRVGVAGSALAYCAALMLNTFSSEMSEWGYLVLMLVFAWRAEREP
ncbi:O-antigen ligase family protein [Castellaniella sp. UC4442_H9]